MAQYFNVYAFTQVATYGKDYIRAAKDTWRLVQRNAAMTALINDSIVNSVLGMGVFLVGLLCGFVGYLVVLFHPAIPAEGGHLAVAFFVAFIIGVMEMNILVEVVQSGVATTFVCLAEDQQALRRTKPDLYDAIIAAHPGIGALMA